MPFWRFWRRRDMLITELAMQLADARSREAGLIERVSWLEAAMGDRPALKAVPDGQASVVPFARRRL